jgi:hypothetical protein
MWVSFQAEVKCLTASVEEAAKKNRQLIAIGSKYPLLVPLNVALFAVLSLTVVSL